MPKIPYLWVLGVCAVIIFMGVMFIFALSVSVRDDSKVNANLSNTITASTTAPTTAPTTRTAKVDSSMFELSNIAENSNSNFRDHVSGGLDDYYWMTGARDQYIVLELKKIPSTTAPSSMAPVFDFINHRQMFNNENNLAGVDRIRLDVMFEKINFGDLRPDLKHPIA